MRHFFRTTLTPAAAIEAADAFFTGLGLRVTSSAARSRVFEGVVGTPEVVAHLRLSAKPEGGHYTFVDAETDQIGESRLDRNVKKFFVSLHRRSDPAHRMEAAY